MRDDLCTYESDDDDDDSTVAAAAAAAAVVDAAEPAAELLPLGGRLPATPPQTVLLTLQPAPPHLPVSDGRTVVVLVLEGRLPVRRFGVVGPHRAGSPTP